MSEVDVTVIGGPASLELTGGLGVQVVVVAGVKPKQDERGAVGLIGVRGNICVTVVLVN